MAQKKLNRQSIRMLLLLLSFCVFPVTIQYLSPGPPLMSLKAGVVNLSVLVILSIFVSGIFFRRAFCGWICPGGGCQLVSTPLYNKRFEKKSRDWIRIILIAVWVMMMLGTVVFRSGIPSLDLDHPGAGKFATSQIRYFLPYIPTVLFIFLFVFIFGRRGFCHRGCWIYPILDVGTRLGNLTRAPGLFVRINKSSACNQCGLCTKNCTMSIDVRAYVEEMKRLPDHCVQCGLCVDQCSKGVLSFAFGSNTPK